ncbi:zinc-dependent alcohol dehydrogenase family protein (plasmid) [Rhizobium sp. CB3090]|uniref:zinc-dependent alcohol dehydrogenase family protein n=1 Tax=Rhizobium sp. CB3090 TaxID=3039156 RepID=UPI0024B26FA3|nr:zinc-dependent alcohol dehydrogenase family protein [Rhizobium sp. CB3090]WFU11807.1 zinc-dependent alcohol dehydrogenase family protein [Rhizobium sp. CB3090]
MRAMVMEKVGAPLRMMERPDPVPGKDELLVRVEACAICRTDLHVFDGDLPNPKLPLIPGHEIVGIVEGVGKNVSPARIGRRVGVPWLGHSCGECSFCLRGQENLCDKPLFTGYTRDGGFATHTVADADFAFDLDEEADPVALAPLMCAGLIGWRSLKQAGDAKRIGLYGFGAAAHIICQVCRWQGKEVYAFSRPGDDTAKQFALSLGVKWAGGSDQSPPVLLDAAIIFAPVGELVPAALKAIRKGGRVVCGGIHMSDIPSMPYRLLWEERSIISVANLTRQDAREFFPIAREAMVKTHTSVYPLAEANAAVADLRAGRVSGAAVLKPE